MKEEYKGLRAVFVPIDGADILTRSICSPETIQYYYTGGSGECETEDWEEGAEIGYSLNWNEAYHD